MNSTSPSPGHQQADTTRLLFERATDLRTYSRNRRAAPHKPLLLLLATGRAHHGERRLAPWSFWRDALAPLLQAYGSTTGRRRVRPEYPFRRLIVDGLWEVEGFDPEDASQFVKGQARIRDFRVSWLDETDPRAGLPAEFAALLAQDVDTRTRLVDLLLRDHFEAALWPALRRDTSLGT